VKLKIKAVTFSYASSPVLENICLELAPSQLLGIVGPNGSGKSTLIKCIDRILKPQKGSILLDEREITKMSRMEIARRMGYVPQSSSSLFSATVFDAVLMGRRPHLSWRSSEGDMEKVLEALELLGIKDLALREVNELSGGEQRKVLLARALAQEADVLLLDEPTSNLDIRHQLEVMNLISSMVKEMNISAVMAIHDLNLASRYSDKIIFMKDGMVYAAGEPSSVLIPENIRVVYGVDAIINQDSGKPYIIPLAPI